eukprot:TRINITY_DN38456_c0_g2_i1.p1 TRINITY_DN38456_c0_g2~~TRINITY_DN38456_c0_g2_i1.p1  ORF type:complete len:355 (-),score=107.01 TRINITY_DN38456_c0_g2_i1:53-1117(-)
MMAGSNLDDAFADFLGELAGAETAAPTGDDDPPAAKRPRQDDEVSVAAQRLKKAERLRKLAFKGDLAKAQALVGRLDAIERLLIVDEEDPEDGFTALHLAVVRGHVAFADALIKWRADVDAQSLNGDTPLMWAAAQGGVAASADMCKILLHAGADTTLKNRRGHTASMQALLAGHRFIKEMIDKYAADVAAGIYRRGDAQPDAAAARRAANMRLVEQALKQQQDKADEEAFWAAVRARREGREGREEEATDDKGEDAGSAGQDSRAFSEKELRSSRIPERLRPHYRTLQAPADAALAEVRRLYRQLALKNHPDKNPSDAAGAKERFTKIALAYEALCEYLTDVAVVGVRIAPPQ